MEVITIESAAWRELVKRIYEIEMFIRNMSAEKADLDDMFVSAEEVCRFLRISNRTLQRLRSNRNISYTMIGHKSYYTIGEVKRVLHAKVIRSNDANLEALIQHHTAEALARKKKK